MTIFRTPHEELAGSPTLNVRRRSSDAQRKFRVAQTDVTSFLLEVFPDPYAVGQKVVIPPAATYPGYPLLVADSTAVEPFDKESPNGQNEDPNFYPGGMIIIVNYKTVEYDQCDGNLPPPTDGPGGTSFCSVKTKVGIGGEFLLYPNPALAWDLPSDPSVLNNPAVSSLPKDFAVAENAQINVIIPTIQYNLTWYPVPFPPWAAIRQCVGKVNAYAFMGAAPETLLFLGSDSDRESTLSAIRTWTLEYKLVEKNQNPLNPLEPMGWNYFLRPDGLSSGQFMRLRRKLNKGVTTLDYPIQINDYKLKVASSQSFPRGDPFEFTIDFDPDNFVYQAQATKSDREWILVSGSPVPRFERNFNQPQVIRQLTRTSLAANINSADTVIQITDRSIFPCQNQFLVQIDSEILAITGNPYPCHNLNPLISGDGPVYALRGVYGTHPAAHLNGSRVTLIPGSVYDLASFDILLLSGLVTG